MSGARAPTAAEVDAIAALPDPVLRNLRITQCYHELSRALAARLGPAANWCTYATWASRQAGQSIRRQDLERTLDHALDGLLGSGAAAAATDAARALGADRGTAEIRDELRAALGTDAVLARTAAAVARGNLRVFAEIGREFARFLDGCGRDDTRDEASIEGFLAELRPGEPPEGQRLLRQAFRRYYDALFDDPSARRTERLLLANLEIGLHEQTRLQPEIVAAVEAPATEGRLLAARLLARLLPRRGLVARTRRFFVRLFGGRTPLDRATDALAAEAAGRVRRAITGQLMTLELGAHRRVRLGTDLRLPYPPSLATLAEPELLALLAGIDPAPAGPRGSGAEDWADLGQRMHFIAELFRCCHELPDLLEPPYTAEQVSAMRAGRLPAGRL